MNLSEAIIWAKIEGLSVMEIARAISWKAGTIHHLLRDNGVIGHIEKRNRPLQLPQIDTMIISALKDQKLSFERWAKGWGWDFEEAIAKLSQPVNYQCQPSVAIHLAMNRDLPHEYLKVYQREVTSFKSLAYSLRIDRHSYSMEWDTILKKYSCKVIGRESDPDAPIGTDRRADIALTNLLNALKQERQVKSILNAVAMLAESDCYKMFKRNSPADTESHLEGICS